MIPWGIGILIKQLCSQLPDRIGISYSGDQVPHLDRNDRRDIRLMRIVVRFVNVPSVNQDDPHILPVDLHHPFQNLIHVQISKRIAYDEKPPVSDGTVIQVSVI